MNIVYEKALLSDIDQMQKIVFSEVKTGTVLERSEDEMATNIRSYTVVKSDEKIVGFVALHIHAPTLGEVRSLVVSPQFRGKSIGVELVRVVLKEAKSLGLKEVLSLTYAKEFFERLGFFEIPKENLPEHKIWADCIKCHHFPVCNEVSLIKAI